MHFFLSCWQMNTGMCTHRLAKCLIKLGTSLMPDPDRSECKLQRFFWVLLLFCLELTCQKNLALSNDHGSTLCESIFFAAKTSEELTMLFRACCCSTRFTLIVIPVCLVWKLQEYFAKEKKNLHYDFCILFYSDALQSWGNITFYLLQTLNGHGYQCLGNE